MLLPWAMLQISCAASCCTRQATSSWAARSSDSPACVHFHAAFSGLSIHRAVGIRAAFSHVAAAGCCPSTWRPYLTQMVWTCNELNAGYAADGYARAKGVGCCVVTFCVGGFSVFNAVAGAYSEDLPLLVGGRCLPAWGYLQAPALPYTMSRYSINAASCVL